VDGSFVEDKDPQDVDVVSFLYRPLGVVDARGLAQVMRANLNLFLRTPVKAAYKVDFFSMDLEGSREVLISMTRYWFGLFSHRRSDGIWKGMLQVRLEDVADDAAAIAALGPDPGEIGTGVTP
jgi:hypothetical protein